MISAEPDLLAAPEGMRELLRALLTSDERERIAPFAQGYPSIMETAWLAGINWDSEGAGRPVTAIDAAAHAEEAQEMAHFAGFTTHQESSDVDSNLFDGY